MLESASAKAQHVDADDRRHEHRRVHGPALRRVHAAERARQHALAREREQVARAGVVEGHRAGERARDDQDLDHRRQAGADVLVRQRIERGGVLALELVRDGLHGAGQAPSGHEHVRDEDVEDAEADDRRVGRGLGDLARLARLLGVVGRHLEADPRPERAEQRDPDRRGPEDRDRRVVVEEVGRVQRSGAIAVRAAAVDDDAGAHHQQHQHLGDERHAEDLGRQLDVEPGEPGHHRQEQDLVGPRGNRGAGPGFDRRRREVAADARHGRREDDVTEGDQQAGPHPGDPSQAMRDERVEAARRRHPPRHLDVAGGEDRQRHGGDDERRGHRVAAARYRHRDVEHHRGKRRSARDDAEQHLGQPERVLGESVVLPRRGVDGRCFGDGAHATSATGRMESEGAPAQPTPAERVRCNLPVR